MMKRTLTAAALAVVIASPAFAQTAAPSSNSPAQSTSAMPSSTTSGAGFVSAQQANDWRGSKLIGATVYGSDNASIGEINDLVVASDGKVNAAVIGVGGFLGVGEKNVAVPFDKLNVTRKPDSASIDKITVSFSKDELKAAPAYAYYAPAAPATTGSGSVERPLGTSPVGSTAPKN